MGYIEERIMREIESKQAHGKEVPESRSRFERQAILREQYEGHSRTKEVPES